MKKIITVGLLFAAAIIKAQVIITSAPAPVVVAPATTVTTVVPRTTTVITRPVVQRPIVTPAYGPVITPAPIVPVPPPAPRPYWGGEFDAGIYHNPWTGESAGYIGYSDGWGGGYIGGYSDGWGGGGWEVGGWGW